MNTTEKKLVSLLRRLQSRNHVLSVKAEFEAEGTRSDELLRLLDVIHFVQLPLTLKIGGCEAVKDLFEARQYGARYVVAPMIESSYALSKYAQTILKVYPDSEIEDTAFLFNLETIQGFRNIEGILDISKKFPHISGMVFGRSDFSSSLGLCGDVSNDQVTERGQLLASLSFEAGLEFVVGGGVSIASVPELLKFSQENLARFETRKVVFPASAVSDKDLSESLLDAVHFEILWLFNKRDYYGLLHREDESRIQQLEQRWGVLSRDIPL